MAFKLTKTNNFKTKVDVITPDGDEEIEWSFKAEFRIFTRDEQVAQKDFLDSILVGVEGIPTEEELSREELLHLVKSRPDTRNALTSAYSRAVVKKNQTSNLF